MNVTWSRARSQVGSALALSWTGLAAAVVVLVLVVDLAAYLVAWRQAQGAADAAALAAVAVSDPRGGLPGDPAAAARRVAAAQGGDLRTCRCPRGARAVEVTVGVPVRAVAVTRFAGRTATATASAHLVRDYVPAGTPSRASSSTATMVATASSAASSSTRALGS